MDPKTMLACLQDKLNRHRLTIPKHIKKRLERQRSAEAERLQEAKPGRKRKKARKGGKKAKYGRLTKKTAPPTLRGRTAATSPKGEICD